MSSLTWHLTGNAAKNTTMKKLIIILVCLQSIICFAQPPYPPAPPAPGNITNIEYFIDSKPEFGSGTALTGFTAAANISNFNGTVNVAGLPSGFHRIYFRSKDANNTWSLTNNAYFDNYTVPVYAPAPPAPTNITAIEYFIDSKPEFGSGTALAGFTASANISNFNGTVNVAGLPEGFHRIYFRSKDAIGKWSLTHSAYFDNYTVPVYNTAPPAVTNIVQLEYFLDNNDLGFGNCTQIAVTPNTDIANLNVNINVTGLPAGVHRVFIRSKDANNKWCLTNLSVFDNSSASSYPVAPAAVTNIVQLEYFLDNNDLGFGNCTQIPVTPNTNIANLNANINITGLPGGVHRLFIRSKDANNKWCLTNLSVFDNSAVMAYPAAPGAAPAISNMEYYIDTDPGFGNATPITVPGNTGDINNYAVNINLSGSLSMGTHYLYIRSKQNPWSITNVVPFSATSVVPLVWAYIKAQLINNKTLVSWATEQEINTSKFEIEHSTDALNFIKIGDTAAAGYSSTVKHYAYIHLQPKTGFNYYRIKQIDKDGNYKYSVIVTVLKREGLQQTIIAPNPVKDILHVVETKDIFISSTEIYSAAGSLVLRKQFNTNAQVFSLPVSQLASGSYVLKINYKNESKTYPFVKE